MLVDADGTCACAAGPFSRSVEARMEGFGCNVPDCPFCSTPFDPFRIADARDWAVSLDNLKVEKENSHERSDGSRARQERQVGGRIKE
jgi:hypothetical protein